MFKYAVCLVFLLLGLQGPAAELGTAKPGIPKVAAASDEADKAIKLFKIAPELKISLYAAEPHLANPVSFYLDPKGKCYVVETFRHTDGVLDIRGYMSWLQDDLASRTVEDRIAMIKKHMGSNLEFVTRETDRVKLLEDRDGDGKIDHSTVFADGFNSIESGLAAGVISRKNKVWFTNIPDLWQLQDLNGDGIADQKKSLHRGYGVHMGFLGHDLHGLRFGPDGRLYFSVGDRGANVRTEDGFRAYSPDCGAVFRCQPDGTQLEVFAMGLRNPQELVFDEYGNLFTGDNNSDAGDRARWVYVVEGGDSGWRIHYQFIEKPNARGPWNAEKLWHPFFKGQAANILPPLDWIGNGPSGLTYHPGTGGAEKYKNHFFLADFRGSTFSVVHSFALKPKGAAFEVVDKDQLITGLPMTDVDYGPDGAIYISDWVQGWNKTGKGRLYKLEDPAVTQSPLVRQTHQLLAEGFDKKSSKELIQYLSHEDMRVRQESQFELADRGEASVKALLKNAQSQAPRLSRIHSIWALDQLARAHPGTKEKTGKLLLELTKDQDPEIRAQAVKFLGELRIETSLAALQLALKDPAPRVQFFAAQSLGKVRHPTSINALLDFAKANNDQDPYLRHALVMGLTGIGDTSKLATRTKDSHAATRMAALLALRRLKSPDVAGFLNDGEEGIVTEAARAIYDEPISRAYPALAALATRSKLSEPAWRRVINANFALGKKENADALRSIATRTDLPEPARIESVEALADWPSPPALDRMLGHYRPLPAREKEPAVLALTTALPALMSGSTALKMAVLQAVGLLEIKESAPHLLALVKQENGPAKLKVEALKILGGFKSAELAEAVQVAVQSKEETVRAEANRWQALVNPGSGSANLERILQAGTLTEKQGALQTAAELPGSEADSLLLVWLDKLGRNEVEMGLQLDVLEASAARKNPEIQARLKRLQESRQQADKPLNFYSETLWGGKADAGKKVFYERVEAACLRCHAINGEGGEVGPPLTGIGGKQTREYILEAILFPNNQIAQGFETVLVSLKDGTSFAGIIKSEGEKELVLNSPEDGIVKISKDKIEKREKGLSAMPAELGNILSKRDLRDLVEFLATQK